MERFRDLKSEDKEKLLSFPAYISLLASLDQDSVIQKESRIAANLIHTKTFATEPLLAEFYREVEIHFLDTLKNLDEQLPKDRLKRAAVIAKELEKMEAILEKMSPAFGTVMRRSMRRYKDQVSRAHHNILEYFIFPMPIKGLSA